jgi:hypothetical protein
LQWHLQWTPVHWNLLVFMQNVKKNSRALQIRLSCGKNELNHWMKGKNFARSDILTQLLLKIKAFWDIAQCQLVGTFRRFAGL